MSKKVAPRVQFNFEPDIIEEPERVDNDLLIDNSDVVNEDQVFKLLDVKTGEKFQF